MMMMEQASLLQRYRRDRQKLLEFLLSSSTGLVTELRTPSGSIASLSNINFDALSVDYVLDCLASGQGVDLSEAYKKYALESAYPFMVETQSGNSYFLLTDPEVAGSPPRRAPPSIDVKQNINETSSSPKWLDGLSSRRSMANGYNHGSQLRATTAVKSTYYVEQVKVPPLGLSKLNTGLSDDDLQESAYEIFLASLVSSGIEVYSVEDKKKEKSPKFLSRLKSKRENSYVQAKPPERYSAVINTIRVQMQISEAKDACIRQRLTQLTMRRTWDQIDIPQISLGLLYSISKSDILHEKSYVKWKSRQATILEELLYYSAIVGEPDRLSIKHSLARVRNTKEWDMAMSTCERAAFLSTIKHVALKLSSLPGRFGIPNETHYWTAGYYLNVRLYEKLLFSMFDVLDESHLVEEADEVLRLIKLTWSVLGITQKMHNAIFGWVLFQQFVGTDEAMLLEYSVLELQKVLSGGDDDIKEKIYMESLICSVQFRGTEVKSSLVQAIFYSISVWCDSKLQDYHLHFSQQPGNFRRVMTLLSAVGILTSGSFGDTKLTQLDLLHDDATKMLKFYVKRSVEAAYERVASTIDLESKLERKHPLVLLANELRQIVEREISVFYPVLRQWYPESGMTAAMTLHQIYGERLEIFLNGVPYLHEDAKLVLSAADMLDCDLTQLYTTTSGTNHQDLHHYPIGEVSKPIILEWVIAQHSRILEWTGRAFDIEDWESLSLQQKQAASAVEVFRIVEETVDQFFSFNLPMDVTHLQAVLSMIFHTMDAYLQKMLRQLVEKTYLYPSAPPLTRYKETSNPVIKKKMLECIPLDDNVMNKLNQLTVPKLCIRLNTLQYIQKQLDTLEDGIRKSWELARQSEYRKWAKEEPQETTSMEEVDELFATTFDINRDTASIATNNICDFLGARVVFWDLRDAYLSCLYRCNVEAARLDSVLPHVDTVLNRVCGLTDDNLRDTVVLSICRASLEGYSWVLLDGGPSRAFSNSDILLMEDDLIMLKEFFVAEGEGLPCSLVEKEAKFAEQVLGLYSLQTETVIQMLMTVSEQISLGLDSQDHGQMQTINVHTLLRVLCHKKDREASRFLKRQYQLPTSSEYDDIPYKESSFRSPLMTDVIQNASFRWSNNGPSSFKSFKKKLQEATSEIRNAGW